MAMTNISNTLINNQRIQLSPQSSPTTAISSSSAAMTELSCSKPTPCNYKSLSHSAKLESNIIQFNHGETFSGPDLKVFVKDVSDTHSKKRPITVKTWSTIKDVKDVVQKLLNIPPSLQRLYSGPLMTSGVPLPNHRSLHDAGIYKNGQVLYLEIKGLPSTATGGMTSKSESLYSFQRRKKKVFDLSTLSRMENDICISKAMFDITPKIFKSIIKQCRIGLACNIKPELVLDGSGGTYFLHDRNKRKIAVFKPADEEPYAVNNPRGYVKSGTIGGHSTGTVEEDDMSMRAGIKPGEACLREVAAFLLDEKGISGVPMTTLVEARHPAFHMNGSMLTLNQGGAAIGSHSFIPSASLTTNMIPSTSVQNLSSLNRSPSSSCTSHTLSSPSSSDENKKVGSCQEFVSSECSMDDISPSKLSTEEVQKIAILDIRILNADRNTANLLCRRNPENPDYFELVPIDHGYCLRTVADVCWFDWCWLDWPQLKQPLTPKLRDYVLSLNIEKDATMLKDKLDIPDGALNFFRASSKLLQQGVKAGLTLYEIAILCCRNDDAGERPSKLETIMSMAAEIASSAVDNGRWHHTAASHALEQQLSPENSAMMPRGTFRSSSNRGFKNSKSIFKSLSSTNFKYLSDDINHTAHSDELSTSKTNHCVKLPEPMAHSSGSDSSTVSVAEEEQEECEQWAAEFIAGTLFSEPISMPNSPHRQRSLSISHTISNSSDDSSYSDDDASELSKSPVGFWFVPPNASKGPDPPEVEDVVWSPRVSPHSSMRDMEQSPLKHDRKVTFSTSKLPPLILNKDLHTLSTINLETFTVDENDENKDNHAISDGGTEIADEYIPQLALPYGMKRSLSYSAFSFKRISDNNVESKGANVTSKSESSIEYEKYFQKFINLLIDRETTPITRN